MPADSDESFQIYRDKLLSLRTTLLALEEAGDDNPVELDQSRIGRLTRMDALAGAQMSKEASRRRALQLKLIQTALQKIDAGSYGECEECLELINPQRLELDPAAPLCIKCASQLENSQR